MISMSGGFIEKMYNGVAVYETGKNSGEKDTKWRLGRSFRWMKIAAFWKIPDAEKSDRKMGKKLKQQFQHLEHRIKKLKKLHLNWKCLKSRAESAVKKSNATA